MFRYGGPVGIGYGSLMSVDLAPMPRILPPAAPGEDSTGNTYPLLFVVSGVFGACRVLPVRSVR